MNRQSHKQDHYSTHQREFKEENKGKLEPELDFDSGNVSATFLSSSSSLMFSSKEITSDDVESTELSKEQYSTTSLDSGLQLDSAYSVSEEIIEEESETLSEDRNKEIDSEEIHDFNTSNYSPYAIQDEDGDTPLHLRIVQKNAKQAFNLISNFQFYLDLLNDDYQTPLHLATLTRQGAVVRRLTIAGARVEYQDHSGNTALHIACYNGDYECVRALTLGALPEEIVQAQLQYDPQINLPGHLYRFNRDVTKIKNYEGFTCLHLAVKAGAYQIVEYLTTQFQADVNTRDGLSGETILHICVKTQQLSPIRNLVLRCKASPNIRNYAMRTPLCLAKMISHYKPQDQMAKRIVSVLQEYFEEAEPGMFPQNNALATPYSDIEKLERVNLYFLEGIWDENEDSEESDYSDEED